MAVATPLDAGEDLLVGPSSSYIQAGAGVNYLGRMHEGTTFCWTAQLLAALFPSLPYLHMCCLWMQMHMSARDNLTD
jgi:hypothetical protein